MLRPTQLNSPPIKVVALVLENNRGEILITQRQKHQHLAYLWEFPGGKVETGESDLAALMRECKEELNHQVTDATEIFHIHHNYPTINVELLVFHEICSNPQVQAQENQNLKWVAKTDLDHHEFPEANTEIIKFLKNS